MLKAKWLSSICNGFTVHDWSDLLKDYRERMLVRSILTPIEDAVGLSHPKVYSRNHFHHKNV